jgi:hypothetical protein
MKRLTAREWTVEEFDAWVAATDRLNAVRYAVDDYARPVAGIVRSPLSRRRRVGCRPVRPTVG